MKPQKFEVVFDGVYLCFALIAGILFLSHGQVLCAIWAWVFCFGDAFHLVPRMQSLLKEPTETVKQRMNRGLQISSITMTVFYILLYYIWKETYSVSISNGIVFLIWITAIIRILICLLPQNKWGESDASMYLSLLRNGVFLITGLLVVYLFAKVANVYMVVSILISFGCYLPVTLWSKKHPMIGMLMLPKTCAYVAMLLYFL